VTGQEGHTGRSPLEIPREVRWPGVVVVIEGDTYDGIQAGLIIEHVK